MLRRQREKHGVSLAEVARRLGSRSKTAYARYEQGRSVPTVEKLFQLLGAVAPGEDFVFKESPRHHIKAA
jgi:transcriptional regulator with XRE-family HTH domain